MPARKVDPEPYRCAEVLVASVPAGSQVVAPEEVGRWIPTFHHHPHPILVRALYLVRHRELLGKEEFTLRRRLRRRIMKIKRRQEAQMYAGQ